MNVLLNAEYREQMCGCVRGREHEFLFFDLRDHEGTRFFFVVTFAALQMSSQVEF